MKAKVTRLYKDGRYLPGGIRRKIMEGDLNMSVSKHPVTGRCDYEASLVENSGYCVIPELHDAMCTCIAAHGLRLRGIEFNGTREVVQEWWCNIIGG
jgi:hypothetical protein